MATLKQRVKQSNIRKIIEEQEQKEKEKQEQKAKGVFFDKDSQSYAFRLSIKTPSGDKFDTVRKGFKTQAQARKAREDLRYEVKHQEPKPVEETPTHDYSKTFQEVFDHYLEHRAKEKRPKTTKRHKSLWEHHLKPVFGDRKLSEVSKGELYNYLLKLYLEGDDYHRYQQHEEGGYSYAYVEGFLKFFWLIYGYAFDNDWVDPQRYAKDFLNKNTKLTMPEEIEEEENEINDIQIYTQEEIDKIREVMKDGNLYITFLICYHCGLRISECMGLMWKDFNAEERTLHIRRQMLYSDEDKVFYLGPPKTKNGSRDIYIPKVLYDYLLDYKAKQEDNKKVLGYRNTEIIYNRRNKGQNDPIQGGDFIQRKENGELITINSVKYWTDKVKKEKEVDFHFHALRHTNASMLAARNIPLNTLVKHLGHGNANVAQKYYITSDEVAKQRMRNALDEIH